MKRFLAGCVLATALAGPALAQPYTYAPPPPPPGRYAPVPPLRAEVVPPPPAGRYIWRPGHWQWTGVQYAWAPGEYVVREGGWHRWVPGHWVRRGGGWVWDPPHWR